jgi:DNA repair exonuclease SbcCD ATPase subunit
MQEMTTVETKIESIKDEIDRLASETNPYTTLLDKCKKNISSEETTLCDYDSKLKYLRFAENIVSQETLRKFIIKDLVVLLNNKIKTYLTRLGAQYYVEFDEDMDYEFITHSGSCEWSNFSAGERMRIMIATSFAFRDFMSIRNGLNANILILDEYFDSAIDTLCVESILSILKDYSVNQKQNIFVISHRPEVGIEQFDRIIKVEKTNGIACVNYS